MPRSRGRGMPDTTPTSSTLYRHQVRRNRTETACIREASSTRCYIVLSRGKHTNHLDCFLFGGRRCVVSRLRRETSSHRSNTTLGNLGISGKSQVERISFCQRSLHSIVCGLLGCLSGFGWSGYSCESHTAAVTAPHTEPTTHIPKNSGRYKPDPRYLPVFAFLRKCGRVLRRAPHLQIVRDACE